MIYKCTINELKMHYIYYIYTNYVINLLDSTVINCTGINKYKMIMALECLDRFCLKLRAPSRLHRPPQLYYQYVKMREISKH